MFQGVIFVQTWYHAQWNLTYCAVQCLCVWHTSFTICTFNEALFRLLLEYRHFQHRCFSFLNLEIISFTWNIQTNIKV